MIYRSNNPILGIPVVRRTEDYASLSPQGSPKLLAFKDANGFGELGILRMGLQYFRNI